jgi:NAD(P)-dependent dehydrogenase (short-subunit alcohol dehydrogenase family)
MMGATWTQFFPSKPTFTEANLPSQAGKVFIVTGGTAGVGLELARILHAKGGTVYITGRSSQKVATAVSDIESSCSDLSSHGHLKTLVFDLSDLTTIAPAVKTFLAQETRLDVLFNNAGIAHMPARSLSAQGYEAHMGTNCLAPFLLTKLLLPILTATAKSAPQGSVRAIFASSSIVDVSAPPGGIDLSELSPDNHNQIPAHNYASSKAGNWFLASEFDKCHKSSGVLFVTQNPGNLRTNSWNNVPWLQFFLSPLVYAPVYGAYTNLWCGLSEEVRLEDGGRYAIPWGRWHPDPRQDILESLNGRAEGGTGIAAGFWKWCEKETAAYA